MRDDVGIHPDLLANYIWDSMRRFNVKMLALDHHRYALVAESLRKIGFSDEQKNIKLVRPSDITRILSLHSEAFNISTSALGNVPHLRWGVNNTNRVKSGTKIKSGIDTGNFIYAKIEAKSRKNDAFMAFVAAMTIESVLGDGAPVQIPTMGAFVF